MKLVTSVLPLRELSCRVVIPILLAIIGGCKMEDEPASEPPFNARIVGSWTHIGGDYPLTNEYRADGTLLQRSGSRTGKPSAFRTEGDYVIVSVKQPNGTIFEQKDRFELRDDTLTFLDADGSKRILQRD